jgi:hypothetical protein
VRLGRRSLTCTATVTLLLLGPTVAGGQAPAPTVAVVGRASVYQDDDDTTVITFLTEGTGTLDDLTVRAGFLADVQTSASVDVVTNATPGTKSEYFEVRAEFTAGASCRFDLLTVSGGYIYSIEHDYRSHTLSLGSSLELFQRNATLAAGYSFTLNEVWRGGLQSGGKAGPDPFFAARDKTRHGVDVSWTQVLGPRTLGTVSYGLALESGFLSSPYRFVSTSDGAFRTREVHPDLRVRHAVSLRVRRYLFPEAAVEGTYRFYGDDWDVYSHTAGVAFLWHLSPRLELELHDRWYSQTAGDFYQPSYAQPASFMSGDKELSPFWDNMVGGRAGVILGPFGPLDRLRLDARFDWLRFEYSNYPLRPQLNAYVSQFGVVGEF